MKRNIWLMVIAVVLSVTGTALGGGYYYEAPPVYYGAPDYYYEGPYYVRRNVYVPEDIRLTIAEYERLKAGMHYYSLSAYPGDMAKASQLAARMDIMDRRIEAWRWHHKREW
jgi:hypothetical protein